MKPSFGDKIVEQEKRERAKRKRMIILCIFMLIIVIGLAVAAFLWENARPAETEVIVDVINEEQPEKIYTQEEVERLLLSAKVDGSEEVLLEMRRMLDEGLSAVEAFRKLYTEELVIASNGKYNFIPIRDDLKKHDYLNENLNVLESGEYQYVENGQVTSYKGIDVSRFQGKIDWEQVAADGVEFAFIRVGNRGYGSGKVVDDEQFEANIKGANAAGVKVGAYFFSQAITEEELLEEVNYVLEKIAPYQVDCPVVYDVEKVADKSARMNALTSEERTRFTKLFCDTIEAAGYQSMFYCNLEMAAMMLNLEELEEYDRWFAYYNPDFYFPYEFKVWQYSEKGTVAGIKGAVDLNISFEPLWD